jgi:hypothetical protein
VERIRPVVDPGSGTVQVTISVSAREDARLRPGQFVNVDIVTETLEDRITLPRTAVLMDGAAPRVFVVQEGRAVEREVSLGYSRGDRVEIASGLQPGDTVVVVGQDNLRPDAPVRLMELTECRWRGPRGEARRFLRGPAGGGVHGLHCGHRFRDGVVHSASRWTFSRTSPSPRSVSRPSTQGVGPREVENLISRPIEEAISVVQGVEQVTSRSRPGSVRDHDPVPVGHGHGLRVLDLRERLDLINLPPDAGRPTIARYDPASEPVIRFALISDRALDPRLERDRRS